MLRSLSSTMRTVFDMLWTPSWTSACRTTFVGSRSSRGFRKPYRAFIDEAQMPRERKGQPPSRDEAEALAIRALAYLAGDNRCLARFLELSGLEPGSLRGAASSPHFLAAVLDHILGE